MRTVLIGLTCCATLLVVHPTLSSRTESKSEPLQIPLSPRGRGVRGEGDKSSELPSHLRDNLKPCAPSPLTPLPLGERRTRSAANDAPAIKGPLSPKESLKHFRLAPGLRIELVACEPQVIDPVAMTFDEEGKLWVVEMRDYPNGPPEGKKPQGRIRILTDENGDGFYEKSRLFADELLFANGLHLWNGGVLVTKAPEILFLKDTDGDGKAEPPVRIAPQMKNGILQLTKSQVLFEGFAEKNPQLRVSHPQLGLDGQFYVANGLRGGSAKRAGVKGARPISLSGRDFRFDLLRDKYEAISGMGQFGNCFDDWGHRFVCDNRHHLRHVVFPNRYLKRNPHLAIAQVLEDTSELDDGPLNSGGKIYPLSKNWTTSILHEGRFTAACGVYVYRGDLLPKEFQGNAFTCDPTGNLVHREILKQSGATFRSKPARKGVEFLASPDDWFRPVFLTHGPDGALYLADNYRAVIEHPQFMPTELKKRPDLYLGNDKGRIWRIVPEKHKTKAVRPLLNKAPADTLVKLLSHPNAWWRTTAQRMLLEKLDPKVVPLLEKTCRESESELARGHALWLLENHSGLSEDVLLIALKDKHPRVREQAVRLAETRINKSKKIQDALLKMAEDSDAQVRFQLALSLGEWKSEQIVDALARIALASSEDPWTRKAIASAVPQRVDALLAQFVRSTATVRSNRASIDQMQEELAELVGTLQDFEKTLVVLSAYQEKKSSGILPGFTSFMMGYSKGAQRRGGSLSALMNKLKEAKVIEVRIKYAMMLLQVNLIVNRASDRGVSFDERMTAIRVLSDVPSQYCTEVLTRLFQLDSNQRIRIAAIRSLASHSTPEIAKTLMKDWKRYTPAMRREVTDAMLRRTDRIEVFLKAIEEGTVKPGDVDRLRASRLLRHSNAKIRTRAVKLLGQGVTEDRKKVLARYQAALKLKGEAKRGIEVFKKTCAACHRVGDVGVNVGPNISDTRTKTPQALMLDILNPNQAIDNNYVSYEIRTKRGQALTGIVVTETASSVTLKEAEDKTHVVLRRDIEEIRSSGVSLMPADLEKNVNLQQMADLLSYLKNWRYLDGEVPIPQGKNSK